MESIPAFRAMRSTEGALVVGFDTEYGDMPGDEGGRYISSYQFAVPVPGAPHLAHQLVIAPLQRDSLARLTIEGAMELLIRLAGLTEHRLCPYGPDGVPHEAGRVWEYHNANGMRRWAETLDEAVEKSAHQAERAGLLHSRVERDGGGPILYKRNDNADWERGWGLGWSWRRRQAMRRSLPLTLVGHYGVADMGTFFYDGEPFQVDFIRSLMTVGGGKVITGEWPVPVLARNTEAGSSRKRYYPVKVTVRDTKALAPAGFGSLDALGELVDQPKVKVSLAEKTDMASFSRADTARWLEYGAGDPLVCLEYCTAFFGEGRKVPHTLASAAARVVKETVVGYLELGSANMSVNEEFKAVYVGERPLDVKLELTEDGMGFRTIKGWTALDGDAEVFQNACANAYRGGLNACSEVGFLGTHTRDFDLNGAYLAGAALVRDVDFLHDDGVVAQTITKRLLTLDDVPQWQTPFVGFVCWQFPDDVKFPTLPTTVGDSTVYVRSALTRRQARAKARAAGRQDRWELGRGTWAMGPEVRAALLLGAEVWCQVGYRAHELMRDGGRGPAPSRCLAAGVSAFVRGRTQAARLFGKGSLVELALKEGGNSVYGKTAQDVTPSKSWDAFKQRHVETGGSAITSPYHAAMTTSLVRTMLLMAQNELHRMGRKVVSVTTDGMITDASVDEVAGLDLGGLNGLFAQARQALTGDPTVWEVKHEQTWLYNFSTRGNISVQDGGVVAQNSFRNPKGKTSIQAREHFARLVLGRTGTIASTAKVPTSFPDLTRTPLEQRKDFTMSDRTTNLRMDFDLKRRPLLDQMVCDLVPLGNDVFEVAHFDTEPWEDEDQCRHAKQVARTVKCLRTVEEWKRWDLKMRNSTSILRIDDAGAAVLRSIVKGHRSGLWEVPNLTTGTVAERLAWLDSWGFVADPLTKSWWRNMGRADRTGKGYLLPVDDLAPYLDRMLSMPLGQSPTGADRFVK